MQTKNGRTAIAALFLLSILLALGAMRSDLFPASAANSMPPLEREALPFAILTVAASVFALIRKTKWPQATLVRSSMAIGLGLFVAPAVLVSLSLNAVSAYTRVALFSLTPVFAVVFEPHLGGTEPQSRGGLLASLVAVAGALSIFPVNLPGSIAAGVAFAALIATAACVAAANCHAVRLASNLSRSSIAPVVAIACASSAAGLVATSAITQGLSLRSSAIASEFLWSVFVTLPALLLLFWLMQRISAARMTTRFLLAPLFAILIGMALDRPSVSLRIWLGILLMAAGAGWLLLAPGEAPDADSSSLSLHS